MHLIPKADDPLYSHDRCQCQVCGYIFLRKTGFLSRCLSLLRGEICPNCMGKQIISLAKAQPVNMVSHAFSHTHPLGHGKA
ncbi:MAG: hypothetical protein K6G15_03250 [Desulfovibrio sp.]|nr:hypothetical protein [Desulfovibrio sp.]